LVERNKEVRPEKIHERIRKSKKAVAALSQTASQNMKGWGVILDGFFTETKGSASMCAQTRLTKPFRRDRGDKNAGETAKTNFNIWTEESRKLEDDCKEIRLATSQAMPSGRKFKGRRRWTLTRSVKKKKKKGEDRCETVGRGGKIVLAANGRREHTKEE